MKREELLALCKKARDVGKVRHEDFVDYVIGLEKKRRIGDEWVTSETAYMSVDGKLAMANEDHRLQGKRLDFEDPVVLFNSDEQLTLMVTVVSEIYGRRHGIATSRKVGGSPVEREFPWEVAETSAIGRALSAMGYGLLPGAGLASAEDMERVIAREQVREAPPGARPRTPSSRRPGTLTDFQKAELVRLYREMHGEADDTAALEGVKARFQEKFGHDLDAATYREGQDMIRFLNEEMRARKPPQA
ncbi:MAG: hypothetical protein H5T65_09150 [Chloroflexi bacterium]|nr:hypothetical protein [Chloroflexota bacterium]